MSEPIESSASSAVRSRWHWSAVLWLAGLFLTGLGAKLWLIHSYGTTLPFWDQWEEARTVYSPFFDGKLKGADLFNAHNEHRILFTRLYDLALLMVNGQWDNQVEMVMNALVHVVTLTWLAWLLLRLFDQRYAPAIVLPVAAALALPFGWENAMSGFHSQHYFMVMFALPTLWFFGTQKAGTWSWWCGVLMAVCGLFSVGAGFIAALAVAGLVALKILLEPSNWKKHWPTLMASAVVIIIGFALRVDVAHHNVLKAHSIGEFLISLGKYLSWPWIVVPPFAAVNQFPVILLAWFYIRVPELRSRATEMTLLLGLWTGLQCLAAAYARGAHGAHPQWRYMDSTSFLMVANALSLVLLWTQYRERLPVRRYTMIASYLWVIACVAGVALLSVQALRIDIPRRAILHKMQLLTTRGYLASGDERFLHTHKEYLARFEGNPDLPQNHSEILVQYINLPHIRDLLPACVRRPLPMLAAPALDNGFTTNDAFTPTRHLEGEVCWSSNDQPATNRISFESLPVKKATLPYLEFEVTGDLGEPGLSLAVVDINGGKRTEIKPHKSPALEWQKYRIAAPDGDFKIVASDENFSSWFAFQAPREVGRLSVLTERLSKSGFWLLCLGVGLFSVLGGRRLSHRKRAE